MTHAEEVACMKNLKQVCVQENCATNMTHSN